MSRDEYFFEGLKQVLSLHALIVFNNFCFLVDEKIELKVLAGSSEITY
jgi:hypothetical protein